MKIVPAVDIKDGECVQLVQGKIGTGTSYGDPVEAAKIWEKKGADLLHIVDLNGAIEGKRKNEQKIKEILEQVDIETQVGGGIRSIEEAKHFFDLGVNRVIIGTSAVQNPSIVEKASKYGRIMVSLDSSKGKVVIKGWSQESNKKPESLAKVLEKKGADSFLYTDVDREGLMEGVETEKVRELTSSTKLPVLASGGISTIEDIISLKKSGVKGVVIGSALYKGEISLKKAKKAVE